MANFDPDVQKVAEPEFLNFFRPVEKTAVNEKGAIALKGVGQLAAGGIEAADQITTKYARDETLGSIQKIRDERVAELSTMDNAPTSPNQQSPTDPLFNQDTPGDKPAPVVQAQKYVQNVGEAKANGKQSDVYYDMLLDTKLKEIRSRFPGYRQVIDQAASEASGRDVANQRITDLKSDLDAKTAAAKEKASKLETIGLASLKYDNGPAMFSAWKAGKLSDDAYRAWIGKNENIGYNIQQAKDLIALKRENGLAVTDDADKLVTRTVNGKLSNFITSQDALTGSEKEALDYVQGVHTGRIQMQPGEPQAMAQVMSALKQKFTQSTYQTMAADPAYKDADPAKIKASVADAASYFDNQIAFITNEQVGLAHAAKNYVQSVTDNYESDLLTKSPTPVANFFKLNKAMSDLHISPDYQQKLVTTLQGDVRFNSAIQAFMLQKTMENVVDTPAATPTANGTSWFWDMITRAQRNDLPPAANKKISELPQEILDPNLNDAGKVNVARKAFTPANRGLMSQYGEPAQVFARWTSPDMTKEVWRLGQQDKTLWNEYKRWGQETFGSEILPREIQNINKYEDLGAINVRWDGKQFIPYYGSTTPYHTPTVRGTILSSFNNLNLGLNSIVHIAEREGVNPEAYVIQTLINAGVNSGDPDRNSIPGKMFLAIKNNRKPEEEKKP